MPYSVLAASPKSLHHDLELGLSLEKHELQGADAVLIEPSGASELRFHLTPQAEIYNLTLEGRKIPFTFHSGNITIKVPAGLRKRNFKVNVTYKAVFNDPVPVLPIDTDNPGYGVLGTISKEGVFILDGAGWYPEIVKSRPAFHLKVRAPEGIIAVTAGRFLKYKSTAGVTESYWEVDQPLEGLSLSAGRYTIKEKNLGRIRIYAFFFPESAALADKYLEAAARYMNLSERLLGPYPFDKFAIVENFFPTGYGFPSYTLLGSSVIRLPFIINTSLGHEIAHSWWGNGVLIDYSRGNWAEGLTTYVAFKDGEISEKGLLSAETSPLSRHVEMLP